jgi:hypothetical protein
MSQVLQKPYDCLGGCGAQIRLAKIEGAGPDAKKKWDKYELDGVTPHVCKKKQHQQQRYFVAEEKRLVNLDENRLVNIEKTLTALKTDVRSLIT